MYPLLPGGRAHLCLEGARQLAVEDGQGLGEVEGAHVEGVGVDELEGEAEGEAEGEVEGEAEGEAEGEDEGGDDGEEGGVVLKRSWVNTQHIAHSTQHMAHTTQHISRRLSCCCALWLSFLSLLPHLPVPPRLLRRLPLDPIHPPVLVHIQLHEALQRPRLPWTRATVHDAEDFVVLLRLDEDLHDVPGRARTEGVCVCVCMYGGKGHK